ncbi:DUF418 domain-containing protein [Sphingorhabdus contaminans]|uniref:DUF418 domain-containing protein n=1 Tax=Sphingorhabdus contaminans TaxID=1343899 RepID=UPI003D2DB40C
MQPGSDRYLTLDAMRGFAVMGILAMNIIAFAMPEWAYVTPIAYGGLSTENQMSWIFSFIFIDGKMRGLFSLLFGASMMLIIERAQAKGESAAKIHYFRMFWLALFGLAHYFFLWFGDILFLYASVGCIAFLFRNWQPERLIKWALIIFGFGVLFWGLQLGGLQILQYFATQPNADAEMVARYDEIIRSNDFDLNVADELALHRGAYWPIVSEKLSEWYTPLAAVLQSIAETLPLMMIGMAMKKNGFITGEWNRPIYIHWARKMVPVGLIASAALAGYLVAVDYDLIDSLAVFLAWSAIPRLMLTVGYAALLILLIGRISHQKFINRVAATGQAAFTNYLGTSILMTTLFYGYGFGFFGHVSRIALWPVVFAMWALMLLWAQPWLTRYRYGPLEWLWRSLARGGLQRMKR